MRVWEASLARAQSGTRFRHLIGRGTIRENYDQSLRDKVRRERNRCNPGRFYLPIHCGSVGRSTTCLDVGPHEGAPVIRVVHLLSDPVLRTDLSKRNAYSFPGQMLGTSFCAYWLKNRSVSVPKCCLSTRGRTCVLPPSPYLMRACMLRVCFFVRYFASGAPPL